jgi:hypothetical protein
MHKCEIFIAFSLVHLLGSKPPLIMSYAERDRLSGGVVCPRNLANNGASAVAKFKADVNVGAAKSGAASAEPAESEVAEAGAEAAADIGTTIATIGVVGVAVALFDLALIPGMVIGVAAAYAPKYVTNLGERLTPLLNYTVRGAYKVTRSARSAVAEAQERMHDIAAEVEAEEAAELNGAAPAHAAS